MVLQKNLTYKTSPCSIFLLFSITSAVISWRDDVVIKVQKLAHFVQKFHAISSEHLVPILIQFWCSILFSVRIDPRDLYNLIF